MCDNIYLIIMLERNNNMKKVLKFIIKRLTVGLLTLWMVITITFFIMHKLPGDPFESEKAIPPQIKQNLIVK